MGMKGFHFGIIYDDTKVESFCGLMMLFYNFLYSLK